MKVEVLKDCVLLVKQGTILEVDDRQYEVARAVLKPVKEEEKKPKKAKK